jgi:hypothetical protein
MTSAAGAQVYIVDFDEPDFDRWMYPFNFSNGTRASGSVFSAYNEPDYDVRDAQVIIGFETSSQVPAGEGASMYQISNAEFRIAMTSTSTFVYDESFDPWQTTLDPADPDYIADTDAGNPVELFGTGFRGSWSLATFLESSPFRDVGGSNYRSVRNAFATDFNGGTPRDISNHTDDREDVFPFAIGQAAIPPGTPVPVNTEFVFTFDLANPDVVAYLQQALDAGSLRLTISSMMPAVFDGGAGGTGEVASVYFREDFFALGLSGRLTMDVEIGIDADLNDDGAVDGADLGLLLSSWGTPGQGDLNGDGNTDGSDLGLLLSEWG